jgi:hypothetical protein
VDSLQSGQLLDQTAKSLADHRTPAFREPVGIRVRASCS